MYLQTSNGKQEATAKAYLKLTKQNGLDKHVSVGHNSIIDQLGLIEEHRRAELSQRAEAQ